MKNILNGKSKSPRGNTLTLLSRALDCTVEELLGEKSVPKSPGISVEDELTLLPVYDLVTNPGRNFLLKELPTQQGFLPYNALYLRSLTRAPVAQLFVAQVAGDSMEDTLRSGDHVLIDRSCRTPKLDGLTLDQAIQVSDYCGLSPLGRKYFLLLVQDARAATSRLKDELAEEMRELKDKHLRLSSRLPNQKGLSLEDAAEFYSSWLFIAIRLYTAIPECQTPAALGKKLGLSERQVNRILKFLVRTGLCIEPEPGKFQYGPQDLAGVHA